MFLFYVWSGSIAKSKKNLFSENIENSFRVNCFTLGLGNCSRFAHFLLLTAPLKKCFSGQTPIKLKLQ